MKSKKALHRVALELDLGEGVTYHDRSKRGKNKEQRHRGGKIQAAPCEPSRLEVVRLRSPKCIPSHTSFMGYCR